LIEDCAQAHGAQYRGQSVGVLGDIAAWSFCQDKIITTGGEGGMVTTNHLDLFEFMRSYKDHGKSWSAISDSSNSTGSFKWVHEAFGTNWRMTEMQAAIGRLQLNKISEWHAKRKHNAEMISDAANGIELLRVPNIPDHMEHAWYKYYTFVRPEMIGPGWSRDRIIAEINSRGVPCFSGTCPEVYLEKAFVGTGFVPVGRLPVAKELGETSIMFMVHPTLTKVELVKTVDILSEVCAQAAK
jgi:dTDP-4-amino-4,6-dideoxygalactose transaminase